MRKLLPIQLRSFHVANTIFKTARNKDSIRRNGFVLLKVKNVSNFEVFTFLIVSEYKGYRLPWLLIFHLYQRGWIFGYWLFGRL